MSTCCGSTSRLIAMKTNELPPPREVPKPPDALGKDAGFVVVLVILAALVAILWFADPAHQQAGASRVDWPAAQAAKP